MSRYRYNEKAYFEMVHKYEVKIRKLEKQIEELESNYDNRNRVRNILDNNRLDSDSRQVVSRT